MTASSPGRSSNFCTQRQETYATTGLRLVVRFFGGWDFEKADADTRNTAVTGYSSTVDIPNATWTNTIGAPELISVWKDPDFYPKLRAFYYVRVLEIPTPRWTAYDAKRFGVKPLPGTRMTTTERAYTSPIWYAPGK